MKKIKRIFAALLSLVMIMVLLSASALAAGEEDGGETSTTSSGVELSKTATLEADGTYTIRLEAYATGEVKTTTETVGVPCDIVLVLDQSTSMVESMGSTTRLQALKNAANAFIKQVQQDAADNKVDHKIAVVGFASSADSSYKNTELLSTSSEVNYSAAGNTDYQNALVSANDNGSVNSRLTVAIERVTAEGSTYADLGLEMAEKVLNNRSETTYTAPDGKTQARKTIVIFFTDGYPGRHTGERFFDGTPRSGISSKDFITVTTANGAIKAANSLKNAGTTVYSVGVLNGANPAASYNFKVYTSSNATSDNLYDIGVDRDRANNLKVGYLSAVQAVNAYLHFVSSDYAAVEGTPTMETYDRSTIVNNGYYLAASSADELSKVFETISSSISSSSSTCTLDKDSVLKDVIDSRFALPDGVDVTVETADYQGNGKFGNAESFSDAEVDVNGNIINVSGFDYSSNYVVDASGSVKTSGKKLIVTIKGVLPTNEAVTGTEVNTNDTTSGIYADANATTAAAVFPRPKTILTSRSYVLDYAKTANLGTLGLNSVESIVENFKAVSDSNNSVKGKYGTLVLNNGSAFYTPQTTNWNGYDSFYAFGTAADNVISEVAASTNNGNLWSKINVIPANNVYYEDDFVTSEGSGTVGIEYGGTWTTVGGSTGNTETADNDVHGGWVENDNGLSDDTTYSDGSAHMAIASDSNVATATFTFTGTGVDIYSRTNSGTGTIYVTVKSAENGTTTTKRTVVDNKAKSGDYYQIPTYTFSGEYGNYEVTVRVTTGAASEGRYTYYLDGIRVYNPIQSLESDESDETVKKAYGEKEINAVFTEVRTILESGAYFIDENENGDSEVIEYTNSKVSELAPEHEVYLNGGQAVVIGVDGSDNNYYYIGLKAPKGATEVAFSDDANAATTAINHSTDLYYSVKPNSGKIVIKNTGNNLLSITKLRTAGTDGSSGESSIALLSVEEAEEAVVTFNAANRVAYQSVGATDEELTEEELPEVIEPETPVVEEPGEVIIENPEVPEETPAETPSVSTNSWIKNLFSGIKNLFARR